MAIWDYSRTEMWILGAQWPLSLDTTKNYWFSERACLKGTRQKTQDSGLHRYTYPQTHMYIPYKHSIQHMPKLAFFFLIKVTGAKYKL